LINHLEPRKKTMRKPQPSHHRYPQTLVNLRNLEGGSYGSFALIARDRNLLEIQLGTDFVRISADGAARIGEVLTRFAGGPPLERVVIEAEEEEEEEEEREVVVTLKNEPPTLVQPKSRRPAPRRRQSV
jgi:hypothetical protein